MMHGAMVLGAVAVGIGATLVMDLWNLFLKRAFGIASLDYCLLGRWVLHIPTGTIRHANIRAAAPKAGYWLASDRPPGRADRGIPDPGLTAPS